jgi:nicotinamide riboside transporter PnuC
MIRLVIERLWPALLPLLLYSLWHWQRSKKHLREGKEKPSFMAGWGWWSCVASMVLMMLILLVMGIAAPQRDHQGYEPAHLENGKLIKGSLHEQPTP